MRYNRFKEDPEDINDDARLVQPSTSTTYGNIEAVKKMILNNLRITIREIADDVGISFSLCQAIFKDFLGMKLYRMNFAQEMLTTFNDDTDLLKKVIHTYITGHYNPSVRISA